MALRFEIETLRSKVMACEIASAADQATATHFLRKRSSRTTSPPPVAGFSVGALWSSDAAACGLASAAGTAGVVRRGFACFVERAGSATPVLATPVLGALVLGVLVLGAGNESGFAAASAAATSTCSNSKPNSTEGSKNFLTAANGTESRSGTPPND